MTSIKKGGYFGELALVTHKPRAASVTAVGGKVRVAGKYFEFSTKLYLKAIKITFVFFVLVLDVNAFERLLGPCMDVMKRNIVDYDDQLEKIFGSKANISDIR